MRIGAVFPQTDLDSEADRSAASIVIKQFAERYTERGVASALCIVLILFQRRSRTVSLGGRQGRFALGKRIQRSHSIGDGLI